MPAIHEQELKKKLEEIWQSGGAGREAVREELLYFFDWLKTAPFSKHPNNPVLAWGSAPAWDDYDVEGPSSILIGEDGRFWLYYHASGHTPANVYQNFRIGLAYSDDLVRWTKEAANPILTVGAPGSWESQFVADPCVLRIGDTYHMWYTGYDGAMNSIGHATSPDGVNWTKDERNPLVRGYFFPDVHYWPDKSEPYWMYAHNDGLPKRVYLFKSSDGINWTLHGAVLEASNEPRAFDTIDVRQARVVRVGKLYLMFYFGYGLTEGMGGIGVALSLDGEHWIKYPGNPILTRNTNLDWEASRAVLPCPLLWGGNLYLFYTGDYRGTSRGQVGFAKARIGPFAEEDFFVEEDGTVWNNASISANDRTLGVPTLGWKIKTIHFISDTAGVLTIEIFDPAGNWRTYLTENVSANELLTRVITAKVSGIRLSFNQAATVSAWYSLSGGERD